jgi:histidinol phosphatase-like PHP family hydrolase
MAQTAGDDLAAIAQRLRAFDLPLLVVPGNHDGPPERVLDTFGPQPEAVELGGYRIVSIVARYDERDRTAYHDADLRRVANVGHDAVVVLQHNPVHPRIESDYPYNPTNADAVKQACTDAGVVLSLSGHYHAGIAPETVKGVTYATAPCICEAPFRFLHVRLRGREVEVTDQHLQMSASVPLWDCHCHTEYAYCGDGVTVSDIVERARLLGLTGLVVTEHAGQLYLSPEDFWSRRFFDEPDLIRRKRHTADCRMDRYLEQVEPLRGDFVRLGLECDTDARGGITLLPEDRAPWDVLVGAVHWIPGFDPATATDAERRRRFMAESESLCRAGVHVLAHPFRFFLRGKLPRQTGLYRPMARLLAETGVAAEVNFHGNEPDPLFIAACLDEGVRIALATDSHWLWEPGELWPHLDALRRAGCPESRLADVLFTP